jgi:2,4-diaminopentanoate dehydrogenase
MPYRVVLWTTGHVARFAGRAIVEHPDMELVGAYAWNADKVGRDVGELIGIAPLGVTATDDVDALLALAPDVVAYYQMLMPAAIPEHVETICRFLERGVNVVSTSNVVTGRWWGAEERFATAAKAGGASLFGGGVNPGWANQLALTATGVCREVRHISIWEEAEVSGYDSPELWESVAFGHPPDEPGLLDHFKRGTTVFEDAVAMMADALDLPLDDVVYVPDIAVATRDLDLSFMRIPQGHVAGLRNRWLGLANGAEVIELGTIWKMTEHVEPNWEIRHGWHFEIDGVPTVRMHVAGWPPNGEADSEVLMGLAMLMTAMPTVHAIPHVVAAPPGVVTYKHLPLVAAAGTVRARTPSS